MWMRIKLYALNFENLSLWSMSEFKFKQFKVSQAKTAAKVGTDAVLLGAWTPHSPQIKNILDVGTGTGVISLMLAQRTQSAEITAIEIDADAFMESLTNFEQSPWASRIQCLNTDFRSFEADSTFDLIVSNPPFYTEKTLAPTHQRSIARNVIGLSFKDLIEKVNYFLNSTGVFSVIIPFTEVADFCEIARQNKLFPFRITHVRGHAKSPIKRSLLAFSRQNIEPIITELQIEIERHQYTADYKELTRDFYLKM